jgi:ATP-dependent Clp protease protease subunit
MNEVTLSTVDPHDMGHHYLYDVIDSTSTESLAWWLTKSNALLDKDDGGLNLHIFSGGGDLHAGLSMYQHVLSSKLPVSTHCTGVVGSAATLPMLAGKHRTMHHTAMMLFHQHRELALDVQPWQIDGIKATNDFLHDMIVDIYFKHSTLTRKKVRDLLLTKDDVWLTANNCLSYGLVDKLL